MNFEWTIGWAVELLALGITIPLALKIAFSIKKTVSKTKNGDALAQNFDITAEAGASPITAMGGRDAFAAQEIHIHQCEDISGKRREALRMLKKANDGIIWAIGQSKNPRVKNTPGSYLTKLRDAFDSNFAKFKETDLLILEPIVDKIIDYRKTFAELETSCTELNTAIDSLGTGSNTPLHFIPKE